MSRAAAEETDRIEMFILISYPLNRGLLRELARSSLAVRRDRVPGRAATCSSTGKAKLRFLGLTDLFTYVFR